VSEPSARLAGREADRFGQLTYSSFDTGDGHRGGWQVKEARGLWPEEQEALTARIATRLDTGPTDRFLTPDQIAALPRRLVYAPTARGRGYWHTVPAGVDGSGRPGNVFAHVLLDRHPEADDDLRPIDLWRSPDWLTPYNPDGVLAARLPSAARPRVLVPSADRALQFLRDPEHWRFGVLPGLLDAVAAALSGGPAVVLGVADPENAAAWIAVVSRLTAPGTARRLAFSTLETADTVDAAVAAGAQLLGVRRAELGKLARRPDLVLIDEEEIVETGTIGGDPHLTALGSRIAPTPWSGLAQVLLDDPDRTPELLAELDALARAVGDRDLPTAWPAAAVVLVHADELADGLPDALAAVVAGSPGTAHVGDLEARLDAGIRASLDGDAARVWSMLPPTPVWRDSAASRLVARTYLERALTDPAWLTSRDPVPLPPLPGGAGPPVGGDVVLSAVTGLGHRALEPGADVELLAVECLRMADLVVRAHGGSWPSGTDADAEALGVLEDAIAGLVLPFLTDPATAHALREAVGGVSPSTVTGLLRSPLVAEVQRRREQGVPLGERLPVDTVAWLVAPLDARPPARTVDEALRAVEDADALDAEWIVRRHRDGAPDGDLAGDRRALVLALVEAAQDVERLGARRPIPSGLTDALRLSVDELGLLTLRFGHLVPGQVCVPVLVGAPSSPAFVRICRRLDPRAWEDDVVRLPSTPLTTVERLIRLRATVFKDSWWVPLFRRESIGRAATVYELAAWAGQLHPDVDLAPEVVCHAQAAWVVAQIPGHTRAAVDPSPAVLDRVLSGPDGEDLVSFVAGQAEPPVAVALAALTAEGSPVADLDTVRRLAAARVVVDGAVAPVLVHAARVHLGGAGDVPTLVKNAVRFGRGFLASLGDETPPPDRVALWEEFAPPYLRAMSPRQGVLHATLGRLRRG
jgi:hypothetical protein